MPWCDECSRYWSALTTRTGTCPTCGRELEGVAKPEDIPKVPWHFTLLLLALGVYLAYRFWQLGVWILHKL
jgi:uncharacterized protein (DUF983 family)